MTLFGCPYLEAAAAKADKAVADAAKAEKATAAKAAGAESTAAKAGGVILRTETRPMLNLLL